jgi:outer membrane phospholipase A
VISRRQNPGLFIETGPANDRTDDSQSGWRLRLGYFHESNGQSVDTIEAYQATDFADDYVSRGWDYILLSGRHQTQRSASNHRFLAQAGLRLFLPLQMFSTDREDDIFWQDVSDQPNVNDYNGLHASLAYDWLTDSACDADQLHARLGLRTGNRHLNELADDLSLTAELGWTINHGDFRAPIYLRYVNGYGIDIAHYHQRDHYIGLGVQLW